MCGRYTLRASPEAIARGLRVALESLPPLAARYNIAPTQRILVLRAAADGQREAVLMRWGLPSAAGSLLVNARAETVARLPAFRDGFARRRCLIPADGFYEWQKSRHAQAALLHPSPRRSALRLCRHLAARARRANGRVRADHPGRGRLDAADPRSPTGSAAARGVGPVADRPTSDDRAALQALLIPPAVDDWVAVPVSNFVNRVANDSPRCIAPVEPERQSELF